MCNDMSEKQEPVSICRTTNFILREWQRDRFEERHFRRRSNIRSFNPKMSLQMYQNWLPLHSRYDVRAGHSAYLRVFSAEELQNDALRGFEPPTQILQPALQREKLEGAYDNP